MNDLDKKISTLIERISRLGRGAEQGTDLHPVQWAALRYLNQANQFSRSPKALGQYLGSTKGTISQTIIALEKKGLVEKLENANDARSTLIALTSDGTKLLKSDPLIDLERKLSSSTKNKIQLVSELESMLHGLIADNGGRMFGQCNSCKFFRLNFNQSETSPHQCGLLDVPLSAEESHKICMEHELG